jgi:hypothetical protein
MSAEAEAGPSTEATNGKEKESYTIRQFKFHATLIHRLWTHREEENLRALVASYITPQDVAKATGVIATLSTLQLDELKVETQNYAPGNPLNGVLNSQLPIWMEAFRQGPNCRPPSVSFCYQLSCAYPSRTHHDHKKGKGMTHECSIRMELLLLG